jgi:PAS domain S-box-containing protein
MDRERELEQYKAIADVATEAFLTIDDQSTIRSANPAVEEIFGYDPDELIGESLTVLMPDRFVEQHYESLERYLATGDRRLDWEYIQLPGLHRDGHEVPLAISFSEYRHEGDRFFTGIIRDNTEWKRLEAELTETIDELAEANQKLEASNERLEQFASAVSHDLQEPLRMVSSYLQLLDRRYGDDLDDDAEEFIGYAVDGADRMRTMIESLLEYSRVTTGGNPMEPTDADAVLADVLDDLGLRIEETDATVTSDDLPTVTADPDQLAQVFRNLISNALRHGGDDPPRVHLGVERGDDAWRFAVRDEGVGIEPGYQDSIFDVFEQGSASGDEADTAGIGLALCERIVERHGGDIWVESEPGEGATFWFTIPATDAGAGGG